MKQEPAPPKKKIEYELKYNASTPKWSMYISFTGLATGLAFAFLSYFDIISIGYKFGPYWLNHWIAWLSFGFIIIYVPIFVILKRVNTKIYGKITKIHQIGFIVAFMLVSLHIGSQLRRVFPPELGTGVAAYTCLIVLVVTGIMRRNHMLSKRINTLKFVHLSMVFSFF